MSFEKQKMILLSHSQNMLNAAQADDWQRFSELDSDWQSQLEQAVAVYGRQLDVIREQLLKDNELIQTKIKKSQALLASELHKNSQSHSLVKQYLK